MTNIKMLDSSLMLLVSQVCKNLTCTTNKFVSFLSHCTFQAAQVMQKLYLTSTGLWRTLCVLWRYFSKER